MTVYYKEFHSPVREVAYKQVTSEVGKLFFSKDLVKIAVSNTLGICKIKAIFITILRCCLPF